MISVGNKILIPQVTIEGVWDISNATYSKQFDFSGTLTAATKMSFNNNGTKLYIQKYNPVAIYQYSLSTAWDITTASYDNKLFTPHVFTYDFFITPNGEELIQTYIDYSWSRVGKWAISTAWDISTSAWGSFQAVLGTNYTPWSVFMTANKLFTVREEGSNSKIKGWNMSTEWDITSISTYQPDVFDASAQVANAVGVFLSPNGLKMFLLGTTVLYQYSLSTAWDITTANYDTISFDPSECSNFYGISFSSDGNNLYILSYFNNRIYQYSL